MLDRSRFGRSARCSTGHRPGCTILITVQQTGENIERKGMLTRRLNSIGLLDKIFQTRSRIVGPAGGTVPRQLLDARIWLGQVTSPLSRLPLQTVARWTTL